MKDALLNYLESQPKARERCNKDRAIVNVLLREYPEMEAIDKDMLIDFVKAHNTMDRRWRQLLEKNPHLRGNDYGKKDELVAQAQYQLGYPVCR
jgi:Zn-dependent M32 family carboxypeptidase